MKILFIVHTFPPYSQWGTETYTFNLAKALSHKHKVAIFTAIQGQYDGKIYRWGIGNIPVYGVKNGYSSDKSFRETYINKDLDKHLKETIDAFKPDIIHFQHLLFLSLSFIDVARDNGIPIVLTLHDYWYICPRVQMIDIYGDLCDTPSYERCKYCYAEYLIFYENLHPERKGIIWRAKKNIYKGKSKGHSLYLWEKFHKDYIRDEYLYRRDITRKYLNMVDVTISPSNWLMQVYRRNGITSGKFLHLDYGIDTKLFRKVERKPSSLLRIGYIGSFIPSKGIDVVIRAIKGTKSRIKMYIWGKAPEGFEWYERKIKALIGKNPDIIIKGYVENAKIHSLYKEIDILIVPSLWHENSPITIHEAFATGTPVIASEVGGIPELIKNEEYGALFPPGDVKSLSQIIQKIIADKGIIYKWSKNIPKVKSIEENKKEMEGIYINLKNKI